MTELIGQQRGYSIFKCLNFEIGAWIYSTVSLPILIYVSDVRWSVFIREMIETQIDRIVKDALPKSPSLYISLRFLQKKINRLNYNYFYTFVRLSSADFKYKMAEIPYEVRFFNPWISFGFSVLFLKKRGTFISTIGLSTLRTRVWTCPCLSNSFLWLV